MIKRFQIDKKNLVSIVLQNKNDCCSFVHEVLEKH